MYLFSIQKKYVDEFMELIMLIIVVLLLYVWLL